MSEITRDFRYAARAVARSPRFALAAAAILGLGIGAATAIFTVVDAVLLRPLPYPESERIVEVREVSAQGNPMRVADPNFLDIRSQSRSFTALAELTQAMPVSVTGGSQAVRSTRAAVSRGFFRVMGVDPVRGRAFTREEQQEGGPPAVVVSDGFWRRALGGESLSGRRMRFEGQTYSVVGVMPPGFDFPGGTELWTPRELWGPERSRTAHNWTVVGRLADGVTLYGARAELSAIARALRARFGDDVNLVDASTIPLREAIVGGARTPLLILLGGAGFLLLIAVANLGNLLLARLAQRRQELAVRLALGARPRQLMQPVLAESLMLALGGAAVGVLMAYWATPILLAAAPVALPRLSEVSVDGPVLVFAGGVALLAALGLTGLAVARGRPRDLRGALASGRRAAGETGAARVIREGLVVLQTALTFVLLAGAALMAHSVWRLLAVDTGFRTDHVLIMDVAANSASEESGYADVRVFEDRLLARLRTLPGARAAGGINGFPLRDGGANGTYLVIERPNEVKTFDDFKDVARIPGRAGHAEWRVASAAYFRAMGIPLLRGRWFSETDVPDAPVDVALVSATFAQRQWPAQDPIGKLIQFGNMDSDLRPLRVIGVVGDVRGRAVGIPPAPTLYAFYRQRPKTAQRFHVAIHTRGDPRALVPAARAALRDTDPRIPAGFQTIDEVVAASTADRRFAFLLLGAFGAAALLLAVAGIYAVVSYAVARRRREIGVRVAFGASDGDVLRLIIGRAALLALVGIGIGAGAALALTRLLTGLLYGVTPTSPEAYALGAAVLTAVAVAASWIPARRAARLDPVEALRGE